MKNIPDKCLKCGAPIKWDKTSNHIDCEYCGYTNLINNLGKFTISEGKKYSFFSSIKNNSEKYLLAIKEKLKKDLKNKNIIFEDLIYKYTRSRKKIAKRNELKILLTALPIGLFVLILNSYINSPLRVQNKKIKDACNQGRIESIKFGATKFKSESKYKECIDFMRETVLSINK